MGLTTNCETAKTFKPVESKPVQLLTGSRKKVNRKNFTLNWNGTKLTVSFNMAKILTVSHRGHDPIETLVYPLAKIAALFPPFKLFKPRHEFAQQL